MRTIVRPLSWPNVFCCLLLATFWLPLPSHAQTTQPNDPRRWEKTIAAFEAKDHTTPPPQNAILFVGSSSIVRWNVRESFPDLTTINRGFGGSHVADSLFYADRIVLPYHPSKIVFYAGENDIAAGKSPRQVADDFQQFIAKVRTARPDVPIVYLGLKPSPSRMKWIANFRETNKLIREFIATQKNIVFVDVETPMLDASGQPREDLFVADRLHLSAEGYKLWTQILRLHIAPPTTKPTDQ